MGLILLFIAVLTCVGVWWLVGITKDMADFAETLGDELEHFFDEHRGPY